MPRAIVSGNGNLLVNLNEQNMIQDLYFPYVGMENQIAYQHFHRLGIYTDHQMSWMYESDWEHDIKYFAATLITDSVSKNRKLGLTINFNDFTYPSEDFFMRKLTIKNETDTDRHLKLFMSQDFHIYGDKQQDTAFYEPENKAMVHYRKRRYFWISGMVEGKAGIDSFTAGKSEYRGLEGTWRDAEDGVLHENAIEQGSVDSTVEFEIPIRAQGTVTVYLWMIAARNLNEAIRLHKFILDEGPEKLLRNAVNYWTSWVNKDLSHKYAIDSNLIEKFKQSLLIVRTQIDNRGAILAANDSDIMKFNKDTYSYSWPRDGAWVCMALDNAGYGEIAERFFEFCADTISPKGYLLHKYNPDQSVGSSWHPWFKNGEIQLPIQEDETATVIAALWQHYKLNKNIEFLQKVYNPLIKKAGNFMTQFVDEETELPLPSYDLWEQDWGVFSYTCATVYAGLEACAKLSEVIGHFNHHNRYEKAAARMKNAILKYLYDEESGRFLKRIEIDKNTGEIKKDYTVDASMHALWMMGVLPPDDPRIQKTNEAIYQHLKVNTPVGGLARLENDYYMRVSGDYTGIPGNPWIITTLWHAQWKIAIAKTKEDLKEAADILDWTMGHMNKAGILPEQLSPFNGEHLSVAPLTWSHSTFVDTVLKYDNKLKEFET